MSQGNTTSSSIPVVNIVSYSYKGGSGRSTASVNIAFQLARAGKLVICLDMDIGAAGLHMILSEWEEKAREHIERNSEEIGHQDYFNRKVSTPEECMRLLAPAMLSITGLFGEDYFWSGRKEDLKGELLFLFSSTRGRALKDLSGTPESSRAFYEKYRNLQQWLARRVGGKAHREVYFIVDAPNGITPVSLPLLKSADLVLMFYRHSLQHIQGTIDAGKKLYYYLMEELDRRYMRILLVGSCFPERMIGRLLEANADKAIDVGPFGRDMVKKFEDMRRRLGEFVDLYPNVIHRLDDHILEDDVLKVLEQPLTGSISESEGIGVKNEHLGYPPTGWSEWSSTETVLKISRISQEIAAYGPEVARRKNRIHGYD